MIALTGMICVRAFLTVKGGSMALAAEKEQTVVLTQITWEDYQNGREMEPVILYFSFNDGTVVEKEVPFYPSIVEKTEYRDITGDGKQEALVYRYFANTATEYEVIDIFEIEDGVVSCISPGTELEELAGNVWNTTIIKRLVDGDMDFIFRMESYDKKNGWTFPDETVLAIYGENGWQILQKRSRMIQSAVWKIKVLVL